jgi:hypothetical protein
MDPSPTMKGIPLPPELPRDSQTGGVFENPGDAEGRDRKRSPRRLCGLIKECLVLDASKGDWEDESWPVASSGWSWGESELGSLGISGEPRSKSWHQM